jgi:hypothetical protein
MATTAEAAASLPSWIENASIFAVAIVSIVAGVYKYIKTEAGKTANKPEAIPANVSQVVAASFVDSKLLRELIDTLREHAEEDARVAGRVTRSMNELREAIVESNEALKLQTDATLNMLRFINRQGKLNG